MRVKDVDEIDTWSVKFEQKKWNKNLFLMTDGLAKNAF